MITQKCKINTLTKYKNGTATAKVRMIYTQDEPVITSNGKRFKLDSITLSRIKQSFNSEYRRVLGMGKKYPRLRLEHSKDPDDVVGKVDSNITMAKENLKGKFRDCLYCDILIMDTNTVDDLENDILKGVSVGLDISNINKIIFKELTITKEPALEDTVLLSTDGQKVKIYNDKVIAKKILELSNQAQELCYRKEDEKINNERYKFLINQANYNKITRADALKLSKTNIEINDLKHIFKFVAPVKLNKTTTFRR